MSNGSATQSIVTASLRIINLLPPLCWPSNQTLNKPAAAPVLANQSNIAQPKVNSKPRVDFKPKPPSCVPATTTIAKPAGHCPGAHGHIPIAGQNPFANK
ncbi:hypothetical protein PCANC_05745 [Puccinia coronata f. sp. avenae]|uniref:Uncharacterized protein n=1 Tax=Puccinia coronata f. sp. avenae TaxID=200324 RepID=A0A2N5VSE6_9BASI|nr:hypothetical protein PCANC_05745 [Puccinia coronata f. sp. avenae]